MLNITNEMDQVVQSPKAIVYFSAEWCQPCKLLKPQYAKLAMQDKVNNYFVVDVDKIDSFYLSKYGVQSIPQIFVLESGELSKKLTGRNYEDLNNEVQDL